MLHIFLYLSLVPVAFAYPPPTTPLPAFANFQKSKTETGGAVFGDTSPFVRQWGDKITNKFVEILAGMLYTTNSVFG
jgi:hypothetical protein